LQKLIFTRLKSRKVFSTDDNYDIKCTYIVYIPFVKLGFDTPSLLVESGTDTFGKLRLLACVV
jgi:hypothetical protein